MSQPNTISHFLLAPVELVASRYRHPRPQAYTGWLRSRGLYARVLGDRVEVLHGDAEPDPPRRPETRRPATSEERRSALESHLRARLRAAGYVRFGSRFLDPEPLRVLEGRAGARRLEIHEHRAWRWELLEDQGRTWLAPCPSRVSLSPEAPTTPGWSGWLEAHARSCSALDLETGRRGHLEKQEGRWGTRSRGVWRPLEGPGWRVVLDMSALAELGCAARRGDTTLADIRRCLERCPPLRDALYSTAPRRLPEQRPTGGRHLRFARGLGRSAADLRRLGVLNPPPQALAVLVVAPRTRSMEGLRTLLNVHLVRREALLATPRGQESLRRAGYPASRPSLATCWARHGLPDWRVLTPPVLYDGDLVTFTGPHPATIARETRARGLHPVALVLLEDSAPRAVLQQLEEQLVGVPAQPLCLGTLRKSPAALENLAMSLVQKAGGLPWSLADLPGADAGTLFVGLDLGHDHRGNRSRLGMTLVDHQGRLLTTRTVPLPLNNERMDAATLARELPALLGAARRPISQVVLHRDGRFHPGEARVLDAALSAIPRRTLLAVKKDPLSRFSQGTPVGTSLITSSRSALLLTHGGRPLEIELLDADGLRLEQAVSQVFWLSRAFRGSLFQASRLPITTAMADRVATTGSSQRSRTLLTA